MATVSTINWKNTNTTKIHRLSQTIRNPTLDCTVHKEVEKYLFVSIMRIIALLDLNSSEADDYAQTRSADAGCPRVQTALATAGALVQTVFCRI
jgi:hypothetical protein